VSTRLAAVLAMRRHAPDGTELGPDAHPFGNECGEPLASIRKSWQTAVLKAHGFVPQWQTGGGTNQLTIESRAQYREIDLHCHDLRHEFASRLLEAGCSLAEVRDLLGHSSITTTSRYLQSTVQSLGRAIERLEQYEARLAEARQRAPLGGGAPSARGPERVQ
jgi:integrase